MNKSFPEHTSELLGIKTLVRESIDNDPHSRQLVKSYTTVFSEYFHFLGAETQAFFLKSQYFSFFPTELTAKQCHNYLADRFTLEKNKRLLCKYLRLDSRQYKGITSLSGDLFRMGNYCGRALD